MPHVRIERFGPGHAEEDTAEHEEAGVAMGERIS